MSIALVPNTLWCSQIWVSKECQCPQSRTTKNTPIAPQVRCITQDRSGMYFQKSYGIWVCFQCYKETLLILFVLDCIFSRLNGYAQVLTPRTCECDLHVDSISVDTGEGRFRWVPAACVGWSLNPLAGVYIRREGAVEAEEGGRDWNAVLPAKTRKPGRDLAQMFCSLPGRSRT